MTQRQQSFAVKNDLGKAAYMIALGLSSRSNKRPSKSLDLGSRVGDLIIIAFVFHKNMLSDR